MVHSVGVALVTAASEASGIDAAGIDASAGAGIASVAAIAGIGPAVGGWAIAGASTGSALGGSKSI